jgi:SAM-dependent methyltransferase
MQPNPNQPNTLPPDYFDAVYKANADPWGFETSPYEQEKYATTLGALPYQQYNEAFEIGCSLGVLTQQLASRCRHLLAIDVAKAALAKARKRCAGLPQVEFQQLQLPEEYPLGRSFDLVLVSEVGYYWGPVDLERASKEIVRSLHSGGHLLLVHWTPPVHDYPLTGDDVHDFFLSLTSPDGPLHHLNNQRHETYRLDLFEKQ